MKLTNKLLKVPNQIGTPDYIAPEAFFQKVAFVLAVFLAAISAVFVDSNDR